jgi:Methyltransferase domain
MADRASLAMGVDAVVRLHDPARFLEFDRALFSLANQSFTPVHPIIVTQNFNATIKDKMQEAIDAFDWRERGHCIPTLIDVAAPVGKDVRAQLLNVGVRRTRHRFLAFLDFDDYLYEDAYDYLVREAIGTRAAIAFGGIVCRNVRVFDRFVYSTAVQANPFPGKDAADLMVGNFCPIHSFVIDRDKVSPDDLTFNSDLERLEDYDLLLRLCAKYTSRFESRAKQIGVYNWHLDGRGTTQFFGADEAKTAADKRASDQARRHIRRLKRTLRSQRQSTPTPISVVKQSDRGATGTSGSVPPLLFPLGHFYSPVADPNDVRAREGLLWSRADEMPGIDLNVTAQLALLRQLRPHAASISYPVNDPGDGRTYFYSNDQYPVLDAEFLHAALSVFRPKVMIEVGAGFSSLVTAGVNRGLLKNQLDFTCIEPYPRQFLVDGVEGITRLVQKRVEDVDLSFFDRLEAGDILFIDSSHVSKVGSDVNHFFFNVLPRLRSGVLVHLHDIFLPDEYPKHWVIDEGRNWNEQYLLRAFLEFNPGFEVIWAAHYMGTRHPEAVRMTFPRYPELGGGGSFWIRRTHSGG